MTYLLDTHVLLWLLGSSERVPPAVQDRLRDPGARLLVSSVSAMEVATKTRLGKLPDTGLVTSWSRQVARLGASELDLTTDAALTAGSLGWPHRDPFDRLLAAQAIHEGARLVSVDAAFATLAMVPVLTW